MLGCLRLGRLSRLLRGCLGHEQHLLYPLLGLLGSCSRRLSGGLKLKCDLGGLRSSIRMNPVCGGLSVRQDLHRLFFCPTQCPHRINLYAFGRFSDLCIGNQCINLVTNLIARRSKCFQLLLR